jgi:dTDP-4-dehydrorhamnose reductase
MKTVIVFGSSGMLGSYVVSFMQQRNYYVIPLSRSDLDLSADNLYQKLESILLEKISLRVGSSVTIINCAGVIKQRDYKALDLIKVNSEFPHLLEKFKTTHKDIKDLDLNVIHITTDCVYSGKSGGYKEGSTHDCLDDYGKSKSLGEPRDLTIIRTSIIGEERGSKLSLLEWVKSKRGQAIQGYTVHFWNGVTCLALAKYIDTVISNNSFWSGVRHIYTKNPYGDKAPSKYELVRKISEVYSLDITVIPHETGLVDRTLSSLYESGAINCSIEDQLRELAAFKIQ